MLRSVASLINIHCGRLSCGTHWRPHRPGLPSWLHSFSSRPMCETLLRCSSYRCRAAFFLACFGNMPKSTQRYMVEHERWMRRITSLS
jgi:hypothetical protein